MDPVRDPGEQLASSELDQNGKAVEPVDPNAPQIRVSASGSLFLLVQTLYCKYIDRVSYFHQ